MAFTVYPVGSNTGFSEESDLDSEFFRAIHALGGRMADFVVSPFQSGHFDITTSGSSYDVDVAAGDAFVNGHFVQSDATETVTVDGSTTNEIFLVIDDANAGNGAIEYTSDGSTPSGQYVMKIWEVTTDGSGVTGSTDFRPWVAFPSDAVNETIIGLQKATVTGQAIDSTGVFTTAVSFPRSYITAVDDVEVYLDALTDTGAAFGFMRAKNVTVDGFDLEYKVTAAGATGATADFGYKANGD